jgi:hypothetical protein
LIRGRRKWHEDLQVASSAPNLNRSLFADDCIFFIKAMSTDANKMKEVPKKYCNDSGQQGNDDKSSMFFGKGCSTSIRGNVKDDS